MAEHILGPLYYERMGRAGRPIAFIHPNPMDQSCWIYQLAHLSTWYRCIAIDIPGYGRSPKAGKGLTRNDMAQACWEALDEAMPDREPAILVGCSVGSSIAPHMYHLRPAQTAALVLSGTGYRAPGTSDVGPRRIKDYSENGIEFRWDHTFVDLSPAFRATPMAHFFANLFTERNEFADLQSVIYQFAAPEPADDSFYTTIASPTIILTGTEDNAHSRSFALRDKIPGCELKILPGAGHACQLEQPWLYDRFMLEFLAKHGLFSGTPRPRMSAMG